MLNMLKMDVYRMFRTKRLYVIWGIMIVTLIYTTYLSSLDYQVIQQIGEETLSTENVNIGISVLLPTKAGEVVTVYDVMYANISAKFLALFLLIFAVIFSTEDIQSGYVKNIAGQVKNRGHLILSKAISLMLFVVITLFGTILVQILSNFFIWGKIELGNFSDFFSYMGTQVVLHYAFVLIAMAISIILKNNVLSMIIVICLSMNIATIFYSGIDKLIEKLGISRFHLLDYTITGKIAMLPMEITSKDCIESIRVSIIFIIVSVVITELIFKKRDIS